MLVHRWRSGAKWLTSQGESLELPLDPPLRLAANEPSATVTWNGPQFELVWEKGITHNKQITVNIVDGSIVRKPSEMNKVWVCYLYDDVVRKLGNLDFFESFI